MSLEDKCKGVLLSFTSNVLHFPCRVGRPTEYLATQWWRFRKGRSEELTNTLYISVLGREYKDYMTNLFNAVMESNITYSKISNKDRKYLGKIYSKHRDTIKYRQITSW